MTKQVLNNQSVIDFHLNHCGDLTDVLKTVIANGISITDDLTPGQIMVIPDEAIIDTDIRDYFYNKQIIPAAGIRKTTDQQEVQEGIGYWAIGVDFKVS